jgi:hypothetical protein
MRMLAGRSFEPTDFEGVPRVAVVNEAFVRKHYRDGAAVGAYLSTANPAYQELEVVGVVSDLRSLGPWASPPVTLYVPNQGDPRGTMGLYFRVAGDPMALIPRVRAVIWSVDPSQPIADMRPMTDVVGAWVAIPRLTRTLVSALAGLSLLLAAVGVFGVVAYAVRSRRAELGVRLALGASPDRLQVHVAAAVIPVALLGIAAGLASGVLGARTAGALLYGVSPFDPVALTGAVSVMVGAVVLAIWLPARRVGRIDAVEAIRTE